MKIAILNGSPKGSLSATLQYVEFIRKKRPELEISVNHISQKIKAIERNEEKFQAIISDVASADAVWWSTPIYVCLVPAQYKRFIELIEEKKAGEAFRGKYTAVLTTSIHFYDHTGNNYLRAICDDLEMKYVDGYTADMYDLTKEAEQKRLLDFADGFLQAVKEQVSVVRSFYPLQVRDFDYQPGEPKKKVTTKGKQVLLLTDHCRDGTNLEKMTQRFVHAFSEPVVRVDLADIDIKGGCLGCCQCAFDNRCIYRDTDGFIDFYQEKVMAADILVLAGTMVDRYLSSTWKLFFDRRFFNNHVPTLSGKQIGFIISGPLSQEHNVKEIISALVELDNANLTGIVTDEFGSSTDIDALIDRLAVKAVHDAERGFIRPASFLAVGGRKIFRDEVWARLRFPFIADYEYYLAHGYFDFPQNDEKSLEFSRQMIEAVQDPETRESIRQMLKTAMVEPIKHIVATR